MKKIMFLYHVKEREYQIIEMIKEQILTYSKDVDVRAGEFYKSIRDTIDFDPDIIVSIPPRDHYSSNYLSMLKFVTRAVIICMVTEGYHTFEERVIRSRVGANTFSSKLIDYYIMWGPKTSRILGERLYETGKISSRKRIKTTGYAMYELDKIKLRPENRIEYTKVTNWAETYDKITLVLTGFATADFTVRDFFYEGFFGDIKSMSDLSEEQIQSALNIIGRFHSFREKYVEDIISAVKQMPERGFLIKVHPVEISNRMHYYDKLLEYPNVYIIYTPLPVGLLMPMIDVMIHYNSTTNMEAYIYGVPTIYRYDKKESDLETLLQESTYCYSLDDHRAFLERLQGDCEFRKLPMMETKLYELFNWRANKPYEPVEKIARYVFNARKFQYLSCFDKELMKAVASKQGKEIENLLYMKTIGGKGNLKELCALAKIQFIKVMTKYRGN